MIFELDQKRAGDWDRFQVRKIGLRMQRKKVESLSALAPDFKLIADAKSAAEETTYLELMRQHEKLRRQIIKLGS